MSKVQIFGILNITPDSFSGDGVIESSLALGRAEQMLNAGASYIDIGAESTRPGAAIVTAEEEWNRLEPIVTALARSHPGKISVDTYHPETVNKISDAVGTFIVNDVTGLNNPNMLNLVINRSLPVIISHLPAAFGQDIQFGHKQENKIDSLDQVKNELLTRRTRLIERGLKPELIILDPGIGFGKTIDLNWKLLKFAELVPGIDVMIGYSKKSFMAEKSKSIEQNLEAGKIAVASGAKYLRLHADLLESHKQLLG